MDLRTLRHVVTLARLLNFTKAAEELGISQPVLSRSIQAIERQENIRLFDRDRGGVHLTPFGRAFTARANALLREADDLGRMLRRGASGTEGELAFGLAPLPARALLASALEGEALSAGGLRIFVAIRNGEALLPLLLAEKIEFFVCAETPFAEAIRLKSTPLGHFPVAPLVRPGHPLLDPARARGPFRLAISGAGGDPVFVPDFLKPHVETSTRVVIEDSDLLAQMVEQSDLIWLTSPFAARAEITSGRLTELRPPVEEAPMRLRMVMYSLDRRTLSPAAVNIRARIRSEIQRLMREHGVGGS